MNNNALLEASNLNNPCPKLRRLIDASTNSARNKRCYNEDLAPEVLALRKAVSRRMRVQDRKPRESYDFLDGTVGSPASWI